MSERKVLNKYYPPDFDPSKLVRTKRPAGSSGPRLQTVRLMAPFSMKCTQCGEYIYKGRKFNARKEITDEKYIAITIYRFYIRCTRCSGEITFKTDPKNMDYACEKGAKRNFEPWRSKEGDAEKLETEEERLDRLEAEEAEKGGAMEQLEAKVVDAKREMEIADALDEIRTRNARIQRAEGKGEVDNALELAEQQRRQAEQQQREQDEADAVAAREAFVRQVTSEVDQAPQTASTDMPPPSFQRSVKKKKDFSAALGIKKKPALV